ncbi:sensor histidine kinase [Allofustis seminis]|uniref:sensor histidine kinase n=1 Tax=Allofustis seminis TaxID=166939 RepID=UPI00037D6B43|nr:sensor histidine kinase [Allofustis seminis]
MRHNKNQFLKTFIPFWSIIALVPIVLASSYYMMTKQYFDESVILIWFFISFFVSFILTIFQIMRERYTLRQIKLALQLLISGNYSANLFLKMFSTDEPDQISSLFDHLFMQLHEKMSLMAAQVVQTSQYSSTIDGQTREDIVKEERQRIARELHDSVSQQLFAASMLLSALRENEENFPPLYQKQLEMIEQTIHESQSEMRALLLHLRPTLLDGKTLKQGIEYLLKELSTKVPLHLNYTIEEVTLSPTIEDHLFRVVQELLSNVLRHAHANYLEVYLLHSDEQVVLRMIDDGKGFNPHEKKPGSFGLTNIQERVESIGGNMRVISFPNQGTHIEIKIPLTIGGIERDSTYDSR